jgi:hypothetical protein
VRGEFIVAALLCGIAIGCSRKSSIQEPKYVTVCGTATGDDGTPLALAHMEFHELAKDTLDDAKANRYELAIADGEGRFKFKAAIADRSYWLAVVQKTECAGVSMLQQQAKRVEVRVEHTVFDADCGVTLDVSLDAACNVKLR